MAMLRPGGVTRGWTCDRNAATGLQKERRERLMGSCPREVKCLRKRPRARRAGAGNAASRDNIAGKSQRGAMKGPVHIVRKREEVQ